MRKHDSARAMAVTMVIFLVTMITMIVANAEAEELESSFQWTAYTDTADGFVLYRDNLLTPIGDLIPVADTAVSDTYENDGKCHNYWLRAVAGTMFSGNSDIAIACPPGVNPPSPNQPPSAVPGFKVVTTTVVTPIE